MPAFSRYTYVTKVLRIERFFVMCDHTPNNKFHAAAEGYDPIEVDRYVEELENRLHQIEQEQRSRKINVGDTLLDAEQKCLDIENKAREQAENIISEATAEAEQVKEAAQSLSNDAHKKVEEKINTILQIGQQISSVTETARQTVNTLLQKMNENNRDLMYIILEQQVELKLKLSDPKASGEYEALKEILKNIPGFDVYQDTFYFKDGKIYDSTIGMKEKKNKENNRFEDKKEF